MGVAVKRPVIVMALYDIGRDGWDSFNLSYNTYLTWMRNTLSLDAKIVVYTEEKFAGRIREMRSEFDPSFKNTVVLEIPVEELFCYTRYHEKLEALMSSEAFRKKIHTRVPEMDRPLYNVIMFNKLNFLQDANDNRYFDNDMLIWADAGGLRESTQKYKGEVWPSLRKLNQLDNEKVTFFSHTSGIFIDNKEYHALSQIRHIQGTAFMVPSRLVDGLARDFCETVDECLGDGYIGSDEKIFDITYCKCREKYNLIKCTWRKYFDIFREDGSDLFHSDGKKKALLDLGSHRCGSIRQKAEELGVDGQWIIHAFEPNSLVNTEDEAIRTGLNIRIHRKAAWKRDGKAILNRYGSDGKSQGSLLEETGEGRWYSDYYDHEVVDCTDISEFVKNLGDDCDVYIFMDIEFSEYEVLENMVKKGWPKNVKKLWVEWHGANSEARSKELSASISSSGTEVIRV